MFYILKVFCFTFDSANQHYDRPKFFLACALKFTDQRRSRTIFLENSSIQFYNANLSSACLPTNCFRKIWMSVYWYIFKTYLSVIIQIFVMLNLLFSKYMSSWRVELFDIFIVFLRVILTGWIQSKKVFCSLTKAYVARSIKVATGQNLHLRSTTCSSIWDDTVSISVYLKFPNISFATALSRWMIR